MLRLRRRGWFLCCLLFACIDSYAATFRAAQFSRQPSDNFCNTSDPVTTFNNRDTEIWAFFFVNNGEAGGKAKVEWLDPNGSVVRSSNFDPAPDLRNWCSNFELSSAANPYVPASGTWTARFTWTDQSGVVTVSNSQQMNLSVTPAPATTLSGAQMTSTDNAGSCTRTPEKTQFLTIDGSARLWFAYPSIPGRSLLKAGFSGPNGLSYSEYSATVSYDGNWCFWKDFDFSTVPAVALPGQWGVRLTVDNIEAFTRTFTVTKPGAPVTLSQTTMAPSSAGGSFTVNVVTTGSWSVVVNVPWISSSSPASGNGNGTVAYTIAPNVTPLARTGIITIGGQTFTVTQAAGSSSGPVISSSDWEAAGGGVDGWTFINDGFNLVRVPSGGNPGAYLQVTDHADGGVIYFVAPSKFLGNKSNAYGGSLSFDLQQSTPGSQFDADNVVLIGQGLALAFDTPTNPAKTPAWTSYNVPLRASAGWRTSGGSAATETQLQTVLANLTAIQIRAEYSSDADVDGIDNVVLSRPSSIVPSVSGLSNGADFSGTVAPGSLAAVFGAGLSQVTASPGSLPFPAVINGVSVNVNGEPAPITYLSPTQINIQIPSGTPVGTAAVTVVNGSTVSNAVQVPVATSAIGLFQYGENRGIVVNADSALNSTANPAVAGSTVVVYLTGIGVTNPVVPDGTAAPGDQLLRPNGTGTAMIGGTPAPILFLGLTPGAVGLAQANITVPANLATGDYPLTISLNGRTSKTALIAVRGAAGGSPNPGSGGVSPLPQGATCVSGLVDSITFSLQNRASGFADEVSIGEHGCAPLAN